MRKVTGDAAGLATWFPALRKQGGRGLAAMVAVVEGTGRGWDRSVVVIDQAGGARTEGAGPEAAVSRAAKAVAFRVRQAELAGVLAALGSRHRLRIMLKLLEGAATYRTLQKVAGLQAGPLYHHIAQLRLAGLIGPKQRDLYQLTRAGRDVLLAALLLGPLARDRRRRPAPQE
ncbi:MAG: winged helix-turn-helix transcriptional regulator [Phycisphaerales bacterium]|nr:MAG: winged helix-turn-helix transcriptional regulator [Phycisphaerales bacterium]